MVDLLAKIGGLFAIFTFNHFVVDWLFQTHSEAMVKHANWKIRAKHCLIYTFSFIPLMLMLNLSALECLFGFNILFWSHFYLDTYHGVFLWCKYIRKPPEILNAKNPKEGFVTFIQTSLGKILMITVDQISHLFFIFPLIYMAIN